MTPEQAAFQLNRKLEQRVPSWGEIARADKSQLTYWWNNLFTMESGQRAPANAEEARKFDMIARRLGARS